MSEIVLGEPLASQIRETAQAHGIPVENLIEAALRQFRFQSQQAKLNAEAEWWDGVPSAKKQTYAGGYVAVHHREVVDHDSDEEALRRRVRVRFGKVAVLISPAEGRRVWRMVSTRALRA
jgi:hypothetical protein